MCEQGSAVVSRPVRSWSIVDFVLIWLGGFLGAGIFLGLSELGGYDEWTIVLGVTGQYVGNIVVFWYLAKRKEDGDIGFAIEPSDFAYIGLGIFLQIVVALALRPLAEMLFPDGQSPQQIAEAMAELDGSLLVQVAFFSAAVVLGPATEELMFRGVLLKAFVHRGRIFVIVLTSVVWAAAHLIGLDPERPLASAAVVLPPVFILGLVLGWVTLRSERLGPAIFLHSGWNLLAAIILLIPSELLESVG